MSDQVTGKEGQLRTQDEAKLEAILKAIEYSFPSGDIGQMLDEIERGYLTIKTI